MTMECDRGNDAGQETDELAARLCRLLEGQLAAGREGDLPRIERLGEQGDAIVARMARRGDGAPAISQARRRDLKRLHDELTLMLRAEHADVQGKLRQLRKVKRAVGAYRMDR
jgi:hypothetical protein